ncbi:MAG: endonuclease/exonuclease/phosphatase family protein [Betaproteobacteria bacterium]
MKLMTWNIQWGRGIDLKVDLARIARTAAEIADFDVLCLQEVAENFPALAGSQGENQVEELSRLLPRCSAHYGIATDVDDGHGQRSRFGNLILSRLPVIQVFRHLLPWPPDPNVPSMQRIAVEATVQARWGPLRVMTTHLEYYSAMQRMAQVEALRRLHEEACGHAASLRLAGDPGEPFAALPRPASAIFTGDFNYKAGAPEHERMTSAFGADVPCLVDAWKIAHPKTPHAHTVGLHENGWAEHPYCCDFIFVTDDLAPRVRAVTVNTLTQASDHQPVLIELAD